MQDFRASFDRRHVLALGGASLICAGWSGSARAEGPAKFSTLELLAPQALADNWLGDEKAPVTIIEYASMTCSHCAEFHIKTFPLLKANYIDTGKARFVLREFPLDPLAAAGFMLARCSGDKREAMVDLLFAQQKNWAFVDKPLQGLSAVVKQAGMGDDAFNACLKDQALFDKVAQVRDRASEKFGVDATPTFFINGDKKPGEIRPEDLDATLAPYLKK